MNWTHLSLYFVVWTVVLMAVLEGFAWLLCRVARLPRPFPLVLAVFRVRSCLLPVTLPRIQNFRIQNQRHGCFPACPKGHKEKHLRGRERQRLQCGRSAVRNPAHQRPELQGQVLPFAPPLGSPDAVNSSVIYRIYGGEKAPGSGPEMQNSPA
jgi:hypothetical protein